MKKNLAISLVLVFISLPAFAGLDKGTVSAQLFDDASAVFSISERYVPRTISGETRGMRPSIGTMIMGGVLGNILGILAGLYLGTVISSSDDDELWAIFIGWGAGSAFGCATGVSLAGHSRYWQGSFGMAMIGGVLGAGLSWLIVSSPFFQENAGILSFVPMLLLPPVVSAIFYRSSMRSRRLPKPGALLNLASGKVGLGLPAINIRPLFVPGTDAKPVWQFSARVLSVTL